MNDMSKLCNRIATFINWPQDANANVVALADCGLYYKEIGDEVTCFQCNIRLNNWQANQIPYTRHISMSRNCQFIVNGTMKHKYNGAFQTKENNTVSQCVTNKNNEKESFTTIQSKHANCIKIKSSDDIRKVLTESRNSGYKTQIVIPKRNFNRHNAGQSHIHFTCEANRLSSFEGRWSIDFPVLPSDLSAAGLYYIGPGDRVACPWCNGNLYNWEIDDVPITEHCRHFPECPFMADHFMTQKNATTVESKNGSVLEVVTHPSVDIVQQLGYNTTKVSEAFLKISQIPGHKISAETLLDVLFELDDALLDYDPKLELIKGQEVENHQRNSGGNVKSFTADQIAMLRLENLELKDRMTCNICLDKEKDILFLPCGHVVCCSQCSESVNVCPTCRADIFGIVKLYNS